MRSYEPILVNNKSQEEVLWSYQPILESQRMEDATYEDPPLRLQAT